MPKLVDHDPRRRQIAQAVWRLATLGGLEDVTLRQVAAEAGVSPRLLQYYFGTRDQLLLGALEDLDKDAEQRARDRLTALGDKPETRALAGTAPLDDERRSRHLVQAAYFVRFLVDRQLDRIFTDQPHNEQTRAARDNRHSPDVAPEGDSTVDRPPRHKNGAPTGT